MNNKKELIIGGINVLDNSFNFESCILNEHNTWITSKYINNIIKKYCDIEFTPTNEDMEKFKEATIHNSYIKSSKEYYIDDKISKYIYHKDHKNNLNLIDPKLIDSTIPLQNITYQRLELVGDGVIRSAIGIYLYNRYSKMNEGVITNLRTKIEKGETLAVLTSLIGLNKYVIISRFMEINNNRIGNNSLLEDIFEAFIGALACTAGIKIASDFFISLIIKEININEMMYTNNNYKDKLLKYFHDRKYKQPLYYQLSKYNSIYTCGIVKQENNNMVIIAYGKGNTKKISEQDGAKNALLNFGVKDESDDEYEELD